MTDGYPISVKCSKKTKIHINQLFKNEFFQEFKKNGVVLNPSWFFKYCASVVLKNKLFNETPEFAYNCHYVKYLDESLKSIISDLEK